MPAGELAPDALRDSLDREAQLLAPGDARVVGQAGQRAVEGMHARAVARPVGPAQLERVGGAEQLEARQPVLEAVPQLLAQQQRAGAVGAVALVVARLQRVPGASVRRSSSRRRSPARRGAGSASRSQPLDGGPARDLGVEAERGRRAGDRRAARALPAGGLDAQRLLEALVEARQALVDVEAQLALRLELPAAAPQALAAVARKAALVGVEAADGVDHRAVRDRAGRRLAARRFRMPLARCVRRGRPAGSARPSGVRPGRARSSSASRASSSVASGSNTGECQFDAERSRPRRSCIGSRATSSSSRRTANSCGLPAPNALSQAEIQPGRSERRAADALGQALPFERQGRDVFVHCDGVARHQLPIHRSQRTPP